ncbi:MAG TPA: hypothetical protein VF190_12260 [Rhodothermales bacterium]
MSWIEQFASAAAEALALGLAKFGTQRSRVVDSRQEQCEITPMLVGILGDINSSRLDEDASEQGRAGQDEGASFENDWHVPTARQRLRAARHLNRSRRGNGLEQGSGANTVRSQHVDDSIFASETLPPTVWSR